MTTTLRLKLSLQPEESPGVFENQRAQKFTVVLVEHNEGDQPLRVQSIVEHRPQM